MPQAASIQAAQPIPDSALLAGHPALQWQRQLEEAAGAAVKVEQSRLLPDLTAGYNNLSIRDGVKYGRTDRFQSFR